MMDGCGGGAAGRLGGGAGGGILAAATVAGGWAGGWSGTACARSRLGSAGLPRRNCGGPGSSASGLAGGGETTVLAAVFSASPAQVSGTPSVVTGLVAATDSGSFHPRE